MMKIFRDEYGQASSKPGAGLHLFMRDFACRELTDNLPTDSLLVDAATLTRILNEAEEEEFARVEQLEERLNYPRNLGSSPQAVLPAASQPRERTRPRMVMNYDDEEQGLSDGLAESFFEMQTDEDHSRYNQSEGPV